ncbi:MAG TPA: sigma 54-interacting transcriptional regulator, partial [Kofleriaceae bacterium]|nr:sigma 54-interacting transcriptional regulator [Kofleriaceae bacterium]
MTAPRIHRPETTCVIQVDGRTVMRVREISLEIVGGVDSGRSVTLGGRQLLVGSDPSNDLVLTDPAASRYHFRIRAEPQGYRILDTRSTNGTFVNGVLVRDGFVDDGARIAVGESTIHVRFRPVEAVVEVPAHDQLGAAVGRSAAMSEVFAMARRAARATSTVLLLGETGTGKDVLARAIHDHGPRNRGPFVVLDCGATSESLITSELFGHVRGAFTGAEADRAGVFERAHGGTLFIDEVGELPLALQPNLLRAIDHKMVTRVGSTEELAFDVRIIAATNRDLPAMIAQGSFRADLYYRLAIVPIEVPPLRERPEDIPLLAAQFLAEMLGPAVAELSFDEVLASLASYRWPGNVRELRNVLERALALADPVELRRSADSMLAQVH